MVFSVDSCCCGCTTRTGCMIIAIINLISGIVIFISSKVILIYLVSNVGVAVVYSYMVWVILSFGIIFGLLNIIMGSILIRGVKQRNAKLLRIHLIFGTITIVATISTGVFFIGFIGGLIEMYFLLVVYSEYKNILESMDGRDENAASYEELRHSNYYHNK